MLHHGYVTRVMADEGRVWAIFPEAFGSKNEIGPMMVAHSMWLVYASTGTAGAFPHEHSGTQYDRSGLRPGFKRGDKIIACQIGYIKENLIVIGADVDGYPPPDESGSVG